MSEWQPIVEINVTIKLIAVALADYEIDEPHHIGDGEYVEASFQWKTIEEMYSLHHQHRQSVVCRKCLADGWINKATFLYEALGLEKLENELKKLKVEKETFIQKQRDAVRNNTTLS